MQLSTMFITHAGPIATLHLQRTERLNAFGNQGTIDLNTAADALDQDETTRVIIITGEGRAFSTGIDLKQLAGGEIDMSYHHRWESALRKFELMNKVVICAINGVAAGGGLILALMSDLRIASSAASFTTVFLKRGLIAEHGSSWLLPRLVGVGRALDLLWMSDRIDAETALRFGLVESVVEPDALLSTACDYVRRLAVTSSPAAIAETKRLLYRHLGTGYVEALREADASQWKFVGAPDAREGAAALLEKRQPKFARLGVGE